MPGCVKSFTSASYAADILSKLEVKETVIGNIALLSVVIP